jgi:hypothetical protein
MPHWIVTLAAALGAWILLVLVGCFTLGRSIDVLSRWFQRTKLHH